MVYRPKALEPVVHTGAIFGQLGHEGEPEQKFIITKQEGGLVYHAREVGWGPNKVRLHREIAVASGIRGSVDAQSEIVLGGGFTRRRGPELQLYDESGDFGSVPRVILYDAAEMLLRAYQERGHRGLERITVAGMRDVREESEAMLRWKEAIAAMGGVAYAKLVHWMCEGAMDESWMPPEE